MSPIRYIPHHQIDFNAWDRCIGNAINERIYAYSWYLHIISAGWDGLVLGDYEAVMPIPHKKKFGIAYIYIPFFTQQLGILYTRQQHSQLTAEFIKAIPLKYKWIELNLSSTNTLTTSEYKITANKNCLLPLSDNFELNYKKYSAQIKRNIKKALEKNYAVTTEFSMNEVIDLFKSNRGKSLTHLEKKGAYQLLLNLVAQLQERNAIQISGIRNNEGFCIAAVCWIVFKETAVFLFSASNKEAKQHGAMSLLIHNFIQHQSGKIKLIDFEGSNDAQLMRFYLGFGGNTEVYTHLRINRLIPFAGLLKKILP